MSYKLGLKNYYHSLEQEITPMTKAVILVHPNNPTGHFTKWVERERLNQICSQHKIAIIADEVFLDFWLGNTPASSFVGNSGALTFTMSGISKISGLPQMKLAWLVTNGPEERKREALARLEVIADTYLSLNAPVQHAAPVLMEHRHEFQKQFMPHIPANLPNSTRQP